MPNTNWEKVKELLDEVLQIEPAKRLTYLRKAEISKEVRAEIESLISFENDAENLMNLSAIEFSKDFFAEEEDSNALVGQQFGVYKIIREIGYGGMGAVYLAERNDGKFEQKVALKLLKREMNTSAIRRRFQQEGEILASLEHPNIARLLDAGTTDDKSPYLAMEFVEGIAIDEYCYKHNLNLNQRLDLFRQVCSAVNFAHRNLIVHRDLKPSNILVTNDGIPKLLDFGISKILSAEFEQVNSATVTRLGAMTPSYASPEQLQRKSVTTATDIYSLGVILYELLSGHRPFEEKEENLKDIVHAVLDTDPPLPSSVLEKKSKQLKTFSEKEVSLPQMTDEQATLAFGEEINKTQDVKKIHTRPEPQYLTSSSLKGDLDNIILKALRKEPERRYSSAENFAEDLHRYQKGLPVTARPNTFSYRAEKFIRRNMISVSIGGLLILAVISGVIATFWQSRIAQNERAKAEKRFGDVRKLANSYLFDIFPEIEKLEGSIKAREKIISTALAYLDSLSQEAEGDLDLQLELATAYERIGEIQGAVNIMNMGDIQAGLESFKKAQSLREKVYLQNPRDAKSKEMLARNYHVTAQTLMWNVDTALAQEYFEKAIKIRRELVTEDPTSIVFQNRLAIVISDSAALPLFNVQNEKAAELLKESDNLLKEVLKTNPAHFPSQTGAPRILRAFSILKSNLGDYEGAIADLNESVKQTNELIKAKPDDYVLKRTSWLNDFSYCLVFAAKNDGKKIIESCQKTVDFNVKALEKEPDEAYALYDLAISYFNIARGYRLNNEPKIAIEYAQKAFEPLSKLLKVAPEVNDYIRSVAIVETEIGNSFVLSNQTKEAFEQLQNAQIKLEKVVQKDPSVLAYQSELANTYRLLALTHNKMGEKDKSIEFIDKSITIIKKLKESNNLKDSDKNLLDEMTKEKEIYSV